MEERWNCLRHGDGQGYQQRKWQQLSLLPHSRRYHPLFRSQRRNQRIRIVEERRNSLRHGDGQGYQQWKWQQLSHSPHSHWQHPLFLSQRRNQRNELWKSDGTASGTVMVKDIRSGSGSSSPYRLTAVGNTLYFRATTEPTDANCGRAMELPQAR